jgi:secretion/DNA translocation related TadE-like protein
MTAGTPSPGGRERGAVTVLLVGVVAVAALLALSASRLGGALTARARAETAADAAALAAADSLALGHGDARVQAERIAAAHGARLVACTCSDLAAEVTVEVDGSVLAGLPAPARVRARAEVDFARADALAGRRVPGRANP